MYRVKRNVGGQAQTVINTNILILCCNSPFNQVRILLSQSAISMMFINSFFSLSPKEQSKFVCKEKLCLQKWALLLKKMVRTYFLVPIPTYVFRITYIYYHVWKGCRYYENLLVLGEFDTNWSFKFKWFWDNIAHIIIYRRYCWRL